MLLAGSGMGVYTKHSLESTVWDSNGLVYYGWSYMLGWLGFIGYLLTTVVVLFAVKKKTTQRRLLSETSEVGDFS